jgi:hypothetical protein
LLIGLFLVRLGRPLSAAAAIAHLRLPPAQQGCVGLRLARLPVSKQGPFRHLKLVVQKSKGASPMALSPRLPNPSPYPSDRYLKTDPLRREFGLRLLREPLPEPLRTSLIRAWRRPVRYDGKQAIQSLHRQRPDEASLSLLTPGLLDLISLKELEVARRVIETPRTSISRDTRNKLLRAQGSCLSALYRALAGRVGEAAALAAFERLVLKVI